MPPDLGVLVTGLFIPPPTRGGVLVTGRFILGDDDVGVFIISIPPGLAFNGLLALGAEPMLPPEPPPAGNIFFFTIAISAAPFGWTFAGCFRHWFLILHDCSSCDKTGAYFYAPIVTSLH
jgi:hypothetical protein